MTRRIPFPIIAILPGVVVWELTGRLNVSFLPPLSETLESGLITESHGDHHVR